MNKKGFTLVEVLAVISILALIMIIVGTKGFGAFDKTKNKITEMNKEAIVEASKILALEIENCDDDIDQDLIKELLDETNKTCDDLNKKLTNEGIKKTIGYFKEKGYVTGNDFKDIDLNIPIIIKKDNNNNVIITDEYGDSFSEDVILAKCGGYNLEDDSLTCNVMNNTKIKKNTTIPTFTGVETTEKGMYKTKDDYGESWYFRGAQSNNYVKFAGFTWRIVRINGDGSVRLILEGTLDKVKREGETSVAGATSTFNTFYNDNAYIGYMYGTPKSNNYNETHKNVNDSSIKEQIDKFYEEYLESNKNNYHFEQYLADSIFCGSKILSEIKDYGNTAKGYGEYLTIYDSFYLSTGEIPPTLKCEKGESNNYSRYTVNKQTINGVDTNGNLTHPIALLSADELIMAGADSTSISPNKSFYLYNSEKWWTMTPIYYWGDSILGIYIWENDLINSGYVGTQNYGIRPVINLKSSVKINEGIGTKENPYILKEEPYVPKKVLCSNNEYEVEEGTLTCSIMTNNKITKNTTSPSFTGIETAEKGMYKAEDDYGNSWYFRGAQSNNYVNFAGFPWRIVRINGDGSVRLILDGTLDAVSACDDTTICKTTAFKSSPYNDNTYVGYMYGLAGTTTANNRCLVMLNGKVTDKVSSYTTQSDCEINGGKWTTTGYEATHANVGSSTIKTQLDTFYQKYLSDYKYYLSDTMFCGDKTLASASIGSSNKATGFGTDKTYYATLERLYYSSGTTSVSPTNPANPTLKCANGASDNYSRYTVNGKSTNKGIETNGDLTYPIALLSADELVMAGAFKSIINKSYYLYNSNTLYKYWWTMSPSEFSGSYAYEFNSRATSYSLYRIYSYGTYGVRPVINIKPTVLVDSGDGTSSNPYTLKLS